MSKTTVKNLTTMFKEGRELTKDLPRSATSKRKLPKWNIYTTLLLLPLSNGIELLLLDGRNKTVTNSDMANLQTNAQNDQTNLQGQQGEQKDDGISWWCKILARTCCVVAGLTAMAMGMWRIITFTPLCLVAGIILMLLGFFEIVMEAPCCCQFLDCVQAISRFSERRSYWQKALVYAIPPFLPPLLCFSMTTVVGSAVLIASGVIYGLIALGRKADRTTMMSRARGSDVEMDATLVNSEISPSPYTSNK